MAAISLSKLNKHYGSLFHAVKDVDLEIADKEFVALVGPSGCGKSTTLRMIAGLEDISSGDIRIGGKLVNHLPPRDRDVAMVFQNYALYQHMSVYDNLAFGLRNKRVALGRAIVRNADVFLMDEPLSNLDAKLRVQTRAELIKLHERVSTTTIYVTHDQVEAMTMGDRIAVMSLGVLQQLDSPQNLYDLPANKFVAGFIGSPAMNFVDVTLEAKDGKIHARTPGFSLLAPWRNAKALSNYVGQTVTMGVRPEHLVEISHLPNAVRDIAIPVTVDIVEQLGNEIFVYLLNNGTLLTSRMAPDANVHRGDRIEVSAAPENLHFFDPQTEAAIR
jgi:multiple sugar transport system ATP-binding protein